MPFISQRLDINSLTLNNNLEYKYTVKEELKIRNRYKSKKYIMYFNEIDNLLKFNKFKSVDILDVTKLGKVGIDRVKLYVDIVSMDFDRIPNKDSLGKVEDNNGLLIQDESTQKSRYINKYNYVSGLNKESIRYGLKIIQVDNPRNQTREYKVLLDVTVPRVCYGSHNIYNVNEASKVDSVFNSIYYELYNNGIHINLEKSELQSIELNKTFEWNQQLIKQQDVLDYIFQILQKNKSNKSKSKFKKEIYTGMADGVTYAISSTRATIKIYDKSSQIFNTIGLNVKTNLCRTELTLNRSGIQNSFGSNKLNILRDIKKIEEVFLSYMSKSFIRPIIKHINKEIKLIEGLIVECNYRTLNKVYKSISKELIDIILLGIAAFNTYKVNNNNNFDRDFKKLFTAVSSAHIGRYSIILRLVSSINGSIMELIDIPNKLDKYINYPQINRTNDVA